MSVFETVPGRWTTQRSHCTHAVPVSLARRTPLRKNTSFQAESTRPPLTSKALPSGRKHYPLSRQKDSSHAESIPCSHAKKHFMQKNDPRCHSPGLPCEKTPPFRQKAFAPSHVKSTHLMQKTLPPLTSKALPSAKKHSPQAQNTPPSHVKKHPPMQKALAPNTSKAFPSGRKHSPPLT